MKSHAINDFSGVKENFTVTTKDREFQSGKNSTSDSCGIPWNYCHHERPVFLQNRSFRNSCNYLRSSPISVGDDDDELDEPPSGQHERWDYMLQQLIQYREKYGDTLVPMEFDPNPKLGTWGKYDSCLEEEEWSC